MNAPEFNLLNAVLLFAAALVGGAMNAVAGGGSFIAFPTLLFTGVPPVPANATNTVALWSGLAFSGGVFRHHVNVRGRVLWVLLTASFLGGIIGSLLLLRTPAHTFMRILPWLMLAATLLFTFGPKLTPSGASPMVHEPSAMVLLGATVFQLLVAIYGGYFGGGMGIVVLAMLTAFGMADIHHMNALKTLLGTATNGVAVLIFVISRAVYWRQAAVMIAGAAFGGYLGAHYSLHWPQRIVRCFVVAIGAVMTAYFFFRA